MPSHTLIIAGATLIGLTIIVAALLHGWNAWLALRAREIEQSYAPGSPDGFASCNHSLARIEIADLRERVRKLEDIAAGIDV